MAARDPESPSARDPLSQIRGSPSLDAVWRDALSGNSSTEGRAALIAHYRAERARHFKKDIPSGN
jgi:hypothetical protein